MTITQNASCVPSPGKSTFMPKKNPTEGASGRIAHADDRQQAQDVVLAVREDQSVRRLEAVDQILDSC